MGRKEVVQVNTRFRKDLHDEMEKVTLSPYSRFDTVQDVIKECVRQQLPDIIAEQEKHDQS